ncbi:MAG TPA: DUF1127 domain-containing protein [Xanthobacteraceae bacterium]|nr:DUF1127 domain-containing protein [Xanthobacteraceae bacterium]
MTRHLIPSMTNHHPHWHLSQADLRSLFKTWRSRAIARRELARFTERDFHDIGLTWDDVEREVRKPFWRS